MQCLGLLELFVSSAVNAKEVVGVGYSQIGVGSSKLKRLKYLYSVLDTNKWYVFYQIRIEENATLQALPSV